MCRVLHLSVLPLSDDFDLSYNMPWSGVGRMRYTAKNDSCCSWNELACGGHAELIG